MVNPANQYYLQQVMPFTGLPSEHYEEFYIQFINNFVEFVQVIPITIDDVLSSLLNQGLVRGLNVLNQFIIEHPEAPLIERYAAFTAAVLLDIANIVTQYKIYITDQEGNFIKRWDVFASSLVRDDEAEFYKIIPLLGYYQRAKNNLVLLLAKQIIPESGFSWLASKLVVFIDWLEALKGEDGEGTTRFKLVLEHYLHSETQGVARDLPSTEVQQMDSSATHLADSFMSWLRQSIRLGKISINSPDAFVHMTREGVFIQQANAFTAFNATSPEVSFNIPLLYRQTGNLMGFLKFCEKDGRTMQYYSDFPDQHKTKLSLGFPSVVGIHRRHLLEGFLITDPYMLFTEGTVPEASKHLRPIDPKKSAEALPQLSSESKSNPPRPSNKPL